MPIVIKLCGARFALSVYGNLNGKKNDRVESFVIVARSENPLYKIMG